VRSGFAGSAAGAVAGALRNHEQIVANNPFSFSEVALAVSAFGFSATIGAGCAGVMPLMAASWRGALASAPEEDCLLSSSVGTSTIL
jgi:hypothetical protein